jgi:hypothetical protein
MKALRIYIDTSVIGGCLDKEFAPWSNGLLRDFKLGNFIPVISDVVSAEIQEAPEIVRTVYADLLGAYVEHVEITDEVVHLANVYVQRGIVTQKYYDDGLHVSLATVHGVDVIVSWNFRHIVHLDKIRLFNAANMENGYNPIQRYSPREVTNYEVTEYESTGN